MKMPYSLTHRVSKYTHFLTWKAPRCPKLTLIASLTSAFFVQYPLIIFMYYLSGFGGVILIFDILAQKSSFVWDLELRTCRYFSCSFGFSKFNVRYSVGFTTSRCFMSSGRPMYYQYLTYNILQPNPTIAAVLRNLIVWYSNSTL